MRAVEMSKKVKAPKKETATDAKIELSYEEKKQLNRAVSNAEKKIAKIEDEIAKLDTIMADFEFYASPTADQTIKKHKELGEDLERALEAWEKAQMKLDMAL